MPDEKKDMRRENRLSARKLKSGGILQLHASAHTCKCAHELALMDGISVSDAIRKAIRLEYARRVLIEPHL